MKREFVGGLYPGDEAVQYGGSYRADLQGDRICDECGRFIPRGTTVLGSTIMVTHRGFPSVSTSRFTATCRACAKEALAVIEVHEA